MSQPKDTPWGPAEHAAHLGNGVLSISTPRHGGLFLPDKVFCEIPAPEPPPRERTGPRRTATCPW